MMKKYNTINDDIISENAPRVSVIVINFNGLNFLGPCLSSLEKLAYRNYEVILLDNNSSDNSVNFVKEYFPWVKVLALDRNYGFAEGNNKAAEIASGKYIAFLNNDTEVDTKWLTELIRVAELDENIGICTSKIYLLGQGRLLNSVGGTINLIGQGWDKGYLEEDFGQYDQITDVFDPCGAAFLIRKHVGSLIGYFEKSHFAYYEDVDIGWKTWLFGYKVVFVPNAIVYHKWRGTFCDVNSTFKIFLYERNRIMTFIRNFSTLTMIKLLPLLLINEFIRAMGYVIIFNEFRYISTRLNIYLCIIRKLPHILKTRNYIQKSRKIKDKDILKFFKTDVARFGELKSNKASLAILFLEAIMKFYKKFLM